MHIIIFIVAKILELTYIFLSAYFVTYTRVLPIMLTWSSKSFCVATSFRLCSIFSEEGGPEVTSCMGAMSLQLCLTLCDPIDYSLLDSYVLGTKTRIWVGCHAILQGIFPTELLSPAAPVLQVDSLPLNHWGSPTGSMLKVIHKINSRARI